MRKAELEQEHKNLQVKYERLTRLLRSTQSRALGAIHLLNQALEEDDTYEETASEQVARCDAAIFSASAYLARIVAPAALTQEQADQTVQHWKERGFALNEDLDSYWETVLEQSMPEDVVASTLISIETTIAQAMERVDCYIDSSDERNDLSPLHEACNRLYETLALVQGLFLKKGSQATVLLEQVVNHVEMLLTNMFDSGEAYDNHEQEETYGKPYPDVQTVMTAVEKAKAYLSAQGSLWWPEYAVPYPDGSGRVLKVHSLEAFDKAVLQVCAMRFASSEGQEDYLEARAQGDRFDSGDFIRETVDVLLPDRETDELLTFVAFEPDFFLTAPRDYSYTNSLAPAAIVYEQVYQHAFTLLEENLSAVLELAGLLLSEKQRLEGQRATVMCCDVCGQGPWGCFWGPFASENQVLRIEPGKSEIPVAAFAVCERCKRHLEQCKRLSVPFAGKLYQASAAEMVEQ